MCHFEPDVSKALFLIWTSSLECRAQSPAYDLYTHSRTKWIKSGPVCDSW